MKKMIWIILVVILVVIAVAVFYNNSEEEITNFEECIAAGNPAMESYPRQCRDLASDRTFVEVIDDVNSMGGYDENSEPLNDENCDIEFTEYFVEPSYVEKVGQIGALHGSGKFTVGRSYVSLKNDLEVDKIPIYAPTDMFLYMGAYYQDLMSVGEEGYLPDYSLDFDAGCGVTITYAHLKEVVDSIKNQLPDVKSDSRTNQLERVEFVAGDLVGYFIQNTGVAGFDFMVHDSNVVNQFANQARQEFGYGTNILHAVCPYDFYSGQKKDDYYSLIGGGGGMLFEVQECGPISRDFPGTISGLWFLDKEVTRGIYDHYMDGDYGSVLPVTGNEERIEIGLLGDRSQNWVYFSSPTYKLPGEITEEHCYEFWGGNPDENSGWAYFKLIDDETMDVVYSASGRCPDGFPEGGKRYYR